MAPLTSDTQSGLRKFAQRLSKMRPEERGRSWSTRTQPWGGGTDGLGDRGTGQLPQDREGMGVWEAAALKRLKQASRSPLGSLLQDALRPGLGQPPWACLLQPCLHLDYTKETA